VKEFVGDLVDSVRKSASEHSDDAFADGYNDAANICVGVLSETIDGLLKQIKLGSYLSDQEQFLLSKLNELKSQTENALSDFWANTDSGRGNVEYS
jgi:hypothetical protein